jgi:pyridoxamine 5'-phosphate oxidase-like protein
MGIQEYFEGKKGLGIISTADAEGRVNSAVYSRPHFLEDGTVAFVMRDRLTRANLNINPYASYAFVENGQGYKGKRLYLKKIGEERETDRLYALKRRTGGGGRSDKDDPRYLVFFELQRELPLVTKARS